METIPTASQARNDRPAYWNITDVAYAINYATRSGRNYAFALVDEDMKGKLIRLGYELENSSDSFIKIKW